MMAKTARGARATAAGSCSGVRINMRSTTGIQNIRSYSLTCKGYSTAPAILARYISVFVLFSQRCGCNNVLSNCAQTDLTPRTPPASDVKSKRIKIKNPLEPIRGSTTLLRIWCTPVARARTQVCVCRACVCVCGEKYFATFYGAGDAATAVRFLQPLDAKNAAAVAVDHTHAARARPWTEAGRC